MVCAGAAVSRAVAAVTKAVVVVVDVGVVDVVDVGSLYGDDHSHLHNGCVFVVVGCVGVCGVCVDSADPQRAVCRVWYVLDCSGVLNARWS